MAKHDYVHMPTLEEYSERFKDFFEFKRENGILEVRFHTKGGPVEWSYQMHHALSEMYTAVGHDTKNEIIIITSTDPYWIMESDASSFKEVEESPDDVQRFNVQIYDTIKIVENFIYDIEVPTIAAINGPGFHWEMALYTDITLTTPDFILRDSHFTAGKGSVHGDGMALALQELVGLKRANYMMIADTGIDAQTCLDLGVVNEIVEKDKLLPRAWELAEKIMQTGRATRRLTHQIAVAPWKARIARDHRNMVLAEMYAFNLEDNFHDFDKVVDTALSTE